MAKRKTDLTSIYSTNAIIENNDKKEKTGVQSIDQPVQNVEEQTTLTGLLEGQYKEKSSNLNKLSGARTEVTYYQQVPAGENNALVNMSGFNTSDPNLGKYIKIERLSVKMDNLDMNYNDTEGNGPKSVESEGKLVILPNTITPNPNDRFTMKYLDRVRLYKITDVTPLSGDSESAYECPFICENYDFNFESSELRKQVVEDFIFDVTFLGTSMRTVYREEEYNTLQELKDIYAELGKIYKRDFWDKSLETYLLSYEDNIGIQKYQSSEEFDQRMSKFEFKRGYEGKQMFDGQLIDFILTNRIFDSIEYFPTIPTQYSTNSNTRIYKGTLFYALEKRNRKLIRNRYQLPVELNISSPDAQPVLYGKMNIIHVSSPSDYTLTLFPKDLCDIIAAQVSEDVPVTNIKKDDVYDMMIYIIALYINGKTKNLPRLIDVVYNKMDELDNFYEIMPSYQAFYLFPLIGYISKELANDIVSNKPNDNLYSDPVSMRRVNK